MKRLALTMFVLAACHRGPSRLSVGAAASLRGAMPELAAAFEAKTGTHVDVTFGPSDSLAKQAHDHAALDVLVLADETVLDPSLIGTRRVIAGNPIVLVGPAGLDIDFARLPSLAVDDKIAIGDPKSVPVGRYAKTYLQQLGSWDALQPQLVFGGDAAGVLALAQKGTARLAIVYKSDAAQAAPLVLLDAPANAPVAQITVDVIAHHSGDSFSEFLLSPQAQKILAAHALSSATTKPPDEMDERMRHCPAALDGAITVVSDIDRGVRFTVEVPDASLADLRERARHIVDFAAKKTREGHGGFDGKGGGRMKNCPVVTDDVLITATEIARGVQLDVVTDPARAENLRAETRERVAKFPFTGATISFHPAP